MKFRNFIIVLFALLMVFALASCNQDPKVKPNPEPEPEPVYSESLIYKLTATKGRNTGWWSADKFVLSFNLTGHQVKVNKGDVLTLKYRSTREITMFNIRNSVGKWIYEQPANDRPLPEGFLSTPDEDGWITVTYKFDADNYYKEKDKELTPISYPADFRIDFIGEIVTTDVLEVKDIAVNDTPLTLTEAQVKDSGAYGNIMPTYEETHDGTWQESADWVVFFFEGEPGSSDSTPEYERVFDGMNFTRDWAKGYEERENYTLKLLTDYKPGAAEYDGSPITANTRLFITYVGNPQLVTFNTGAGGSEVASQTVAYGSYATKPETDPTNGDNAFAGWFADSAMSVPFDFESTVITKDTTIYAGFGAPLTVKFFAENGEEEPTSVTVATGFPVDAIDDPSYGSRIFEGWFLAESETPYDFTQPVTAALELHAHWTNATDVTLNLNYTGAPEATSFKAALDAVLAEDDARLVPANRPGFFFDGWYDDANGLTAHDFTKTVTGSFTLYAKWRSGNIAQLISTFNYKDNEGNFDKFRVKFTSGDYERKVKGGEVLSFRYRSTTPITKFNVRGDKKWVYQRDFATPYLTSYKVGTDGWISVEYTFPVSGVFDDGGGTINYGENGLNFYFDFISYTIVKGDIIEIQGMALDGKELTIDGGNTQSGSSSTKPTYKSIEKAYAWTSHSVTFESNGGSAVGQLSVEFNKKATKPENPTNGDKKFVGWFTDDNTFEKEFDFEATNITEDVILYAKWSDAVVLTFDAKGGTAAVDTMEVGKNASIVEPAEPTWNGYFFDGWYEEESYDTLFDFDKGIEANKTIYAKWTEAVTLTVNVNYGDKPAQTFTIRKGETPRVQISRDGWTLTKLTEEESLGSTTYTPAALEANKTVYAHWEQPEEYLEFTATKGINNGSSQDKFVLKWDSSVKVQPGDILSFAFKSVREDDLTKNRSYSYSIRDAKKWFSESTTSNQYPQFFSTFETKEDDWTYVTYVFPPSSAKTKETITYPATFQLHFRDSVIADGTTVGTIADKVLVKGLALNGSPLTVDEVATSDSGNFSAPTIEHVSLLK